MNQRPRAILALSLVALLAGGCDGSPTANSATAEGSTATGAPIQTDRPTYTARRGVDTLTDGTVWGRWVEIAIRLRYTNRTGGSIYLPTCLGTNPPTLMKRVASGAVVAFAPIVPACLGPPVVLRRGQVYDYAFLVRGYDKGGRVYPQFETSVPGTYHLVWGAYETWTPSSGESGLGELLPLGERISNEFEVIE